MCYIASEICYIWHSFLFLHQQKEIYTINTPYYGATDVYNISYIIPNIVILLS